jgi:formate hydrogenlyase subunit 3/multisubunit Na+/H+ antiporter MnhD subunit
MAVLGAGGLAALAASSRPALALALGSFALFLLLGQGAGSPRFEAFAGAAASARPTVLFALALVGFGAKAGLVPLHVRLPEAHPAAPSHVSALTSGVLVKMGPHGILRVLGFLPPLPAGHGLAQAGIGLAGAPVALGLGLAGAALGSPAVAALGIAGALLHVRSHALRKGLAIPAAGSLVHGAGTRDLEAMGGPLRRLLGEPRGAAAASAHEAGPLLLAPLAALAAGCLGIAVFPAETAALLAPAAVALVSRRALDSREIRRRAVAERFARLRVLQQGRLDLQLPYTVLALLGLGALVLLHGRLP